MYSNILLYKRLNIHVLEWIKEKIMKSETTNLTIRLDKSVGDDFKNICRELGINPSTAIQIYIKAVIREQRIPFHIALHREN